MQFTELEERDFPLMCAEWKNMLPKKDHAVYAAEYEQLFARIKAGKCWGPLGNRVNETVFYAVKDKASTEAVVEMVQTKKGKETWIKMFDIMMSPKIEAGTDTEKSTKLRLDVFKATLTGIFKLSERVRNANTFKVYGRTELLVTFLRGMHDALSVFPTLGNIEGIQVSIEGRWLVFRAA